MREFLERANEIVARSRAQYHGVYYMKGGFTGIRDAIESVGSIAGNYLLPGSSIVTDKLVSKGAQKELGSPLGRIAQIGSGAAGAGIGSSITGIPDAASIGGGYTNVANDIGGAFGDPTLGTDISSGISSATNSLLSSLGLGDSAAGAAPVTGVTSSPIADIPGSTVNAAPISGAGAAGASGGLSASDAEFLKNAGVTASNVAGGSEFNAAAAASLPSTGTLSSIKQALSGATAGDLLKYGVPLAGVANSVISQQKQTKGLNQLEQAGAGGLNTETGLINSLQSGQLPPGAQSTIDAQVKDSITAIKSHYASMGMSGSSSEQADIAAAKQAGTTAAFNYAQQATQTGLQALGANNSIYDNIIKTVLGQNQGLSSSLASLAQAAGK